MIRDYPFNLTPGQQVRQPVLGNYVGLKRCSVDAVSILVQAEDDQGQVIASVVLQQGEALPIPRSFHRLVITNQDGLSTVDIVMLAGVGDFQSYRLTGSVSISEEVTIANPSSLTTNASFIETGAGTTIASDANRRNLMLKADPTNTSPFWVGGVANSGVPIYPGETIVLTGTHAVTLLSATVGDVLYSMSQEA